MEEVAALMSLGLFVSMIAIWAQVIAVLVRPVPRADEGGPPTGGPEGERSWRASAYRPPAMKLPARSHMPARRHVEPAVVLQEHGAARHAPWRLRIIIAMPLSPTRVDHILPCISRT